MKYKIRMGIPEMLEFWNSLAYKAENNLLKGNEKILFKKLFKILNLISNNPRHNSLSTHEITALSRRYGMKIWQSYIENNTSKAGRIYWVYGPNKEDITIIGIEPHPEDKKSSGYSKIKLSELDD